MRVMVRVAMDTEQTNHLVAEGTMGTTIEEILERIGPEAAYFHVLDGKRAFTLVVDAPDGATLPTLVEPMLSRLGATVDVVPVLTADELGEGLSRLG